MPCLIGRLYKTPCPTLNPSIVIPTFKVSLLSGSAGHPILPGERVAVHGREWSSLHGGAKRVFWEEYMRRFPA